MKNNIIYQNGNITVTKRNVFGKIGLTGYNQENGASVTAMVNAESQIPQQVEKMIAELQKNARIDLTPILAKIERSYFKTVAAE